MKKSLLLFAAMSLLAFAANAQTKKDGTPDMRYRANKETYGGSYSAPAPAPVYSDPAPRRSYSSPDYSGDHHTTPHGGTYLNAEPGSSHKGGTYQNSNTGNQYGRHKTY